MKASGKIGSNGVQVSDNVRKRFEINTYIYIYIYIYILYVNLKTNDMYKVKGFAKASWMSVI